MFAIGLCLLTTFQGGATPAPNLPESTASAYPRPVRVERENVSQIGALADSISYLPAISPDGRFVIFYSAANNLTPGGNNGQRQLYLRDRTTGQVEMISVANDGSPGNGETGFTSFFPPWPAPPVMTPDCRYVAFTSASSNLVAGDNNGVFDVFVRDRVAGTTELVSLATDGTQVTSFAAGPAISADGRFIAFYTKTRLVVTDTNFASDIYVRDRVAGTTERITAGPTQINQFDCWDPVMTPDGRYVAFHSGSIFSDTDSNGANDIYLRDRQTNAIEHISRASDGTGANGTCYSPSISDDGRYVAFGSASTNLTPRNGKPTGKTGDAYVRDRSLGTTERVSVTSAGTETNENSGINNATGDYAGAVQISADGRYVAFGSWSSNMVPGDANGTMDVYVHDRETAATERVSVTSTGGDPETGATFYSMATGGRYFAMQSESENMIAADPGGGIFVHDHGQALGILDLAAVPGTSSVAVSGHATFTGIVISQADDPTNDAGPGATNAGTELSGASLALRPELDDLVVRVMLAPGAPPSYPGAPGIVYGLRFTAGGSNYEVRMEDLQMFTLNRCAQVCTSIATLQGGFGTTGWETRASVPLSTLGLSPGAALTGLTAFVGTGNVATGSTLDIDVIALPDAIVGSPTVKLGIAPAGTAAEQINFTTPASLSAGFFQGALNTCALSTGNYDVWAQACLGSVCGTASVTVPIAGPTCAFLVDARSRKTHGSAGPFDVILPLTGIAGIECRTGGANGDHTLVFSFANPLVSVGGASMSAGTGAVSSSAIDPGAPNQYVVNLTGVTNAQTITVTLTNVTDAIGSSTSSVVASMSVLLGDTTADGSVNSADIGQTKSQSGNPVSGSNFRQDVTVDGNLNSADIGLVKSKSGTALP